MLHEARHGTASPRPPDRVVVLARGEVTKPLTVKVHRISAVARQKIEAAGCAVETLDYPVNKRLPRS